MPRLNPFTVAWIAWGLLFLAIEITAIVQRRFMDTLSGHIWRWFHVSNYRWGWMALALLLAWLAAHLLSGGRV